eukprot:1136973-Pelagomonas_calceolata.AAC.3
MCVCAAAVATGIPCAAEQAFLLKEETPEGARRSPRRGGGLRKQPRACMAIQYDPSNDIEL